MWLLALLQAAACLLICTLLLIAGPTNMAASAQPETINPFTDFYGWDVAATRAQQVARENTVSHLAVQNWTLASRLAWYARPLPVHVLDAAFDQFSLWSGELPMGSDAVLMDWSQMAYKLPVGAGQFQSCSPAATVPVQRAGRTVSNFSLFVCRNWGGRPQARRWDEP